MGTGTAMSQEQAFKPSVAVPFAAIVLAMLPAVLDQTILATALPTIATDLGRISDVSWVVTAYVVAAAALTSDQNDGDDDGERDQPQDLG